MMMIIIMMIIINNSNENAKSLNFRRFRVIN